jgi:phosphoribosylanthranilate isomerase
MYIRVKICGITNINDALAAVNFGAHSLGFIFYKNSPRNISYEHAHEIIKKLPPFVTPIAVVVNETSDSLTDLIRITGCCAIQYHGDAMNIIKTIKTPIIPAISVNTETDLDVIENFIDAQGILLDTRKDDMYGGTGEIFDWSIASKAKRFNKPIILAGGISPENVEDAIKIASPWAIDVNSMIEKEPGIKDHLKMEQLFKVIKSL